MNAHRLTLLIIGFTTFYFKVYSQTKSVKSFSNYTITIPSGWKESSKAALNEFIEIGKQKVDLLAYPNQKNSFDGPPIIFTIFKKKELNQAEFEKTAREILKTVKTNLLDYIPTDFHSDMKTLKPGQGYMDKKKGLFTYIYEVEIKNVGMVYTIGTGIYTPHGLIMLQFSDYSKNYLNTIDAYIQLVKSVKK